ncbi:MAG: tetratricopeptide (TPR) repeat protein [Paraglaciecola sp.]|jgi:tetratricopeptide (TPR) repeat protein
MNQLLTEKKLNAYWYLELAEQALASEKTIRAESHLISALEKQSNNMTVLVTYGNLLINERRFIEAQNLLELAYQQFPKNIDIILTYYMSLRRQGLIPECIRLCLAALKDHSDNNYLKSELAVAYVMSGNIDQAITLEQQGFEPTLRWQQWSIVAHLAHKNNETSLALIKSCIHFFEEAEIFPQQAIQVIVEKNKNKNISEYYQNFISITGYNKRPVWAYFELLRYCPINDEVQLFEQSCEISLALDPVPYRPRATGTSKILFDNNAISLARRSFKQPIILRSSLQDNILKFRSLCKELINEGVFKHFQDNIHSIKKQYAPNTPDFVQVMSTGRCGTLALYQFLKKSDQVIPFHTMQAQLIAPDRNHILYRILSGKFDKKVIATILTSYLQNRVAEICYAYTKQCTPIIINHWDTIFAPFLAELFPRSKFLHIWRADENVFKSIHGKNQFQNEQLRHCWFDSDFSQGQFSCFFDTTLTIQQQVSWYLFFTREYSLAFKNTLASERMHSIKSEDLFKGNIDKFTILKSLMPIDDMTEDQFIASFAKPINQKQDKLQVKSNLLSEQAFEIQHIVEKLERAGTL